MARRIIPGIQPLEAATPNEDRAMHADQTDILLVPLIDVNWLVYAPFDPGRDFRVDPPNVGKSIGETREIHRLLLGLTGGKYILTPHAGTYCRTGYYEGEMLD